MTEGDGRGRAGAWGAILGLVGGALIAGGTFLPWARSDGVSVESVVIPSDARGLEVSFGLVAIAAGILAAILALVTLFSPRRAARILGAALIFVALAGGSDRSHPCPGSGTDVRRFRDRDGGRFRSAARGRGAIDHSAHGDRKPHRRSRTRSMGRWGRSCSRVRRRSAGPDSEPKANQEGSRYGLR